MYGDAVLLHELLRTEKNKKKTKRQKETKKKGNNVKEI